MSHRDHASYLPFVSSVSPETVTESGSQTITITGSGLTPTTEVSVPAALGTVTNRSFVQNSSVSQSIVLTVTVAEPPGTPVARSIGLKNGGLGTATTSVTHGFSPSSLLTGPGDEYYQPSGISGSDGVKFSTWNAEVMAGEPAQTLSASSGYWQPKYFTSAINGEPGALLVAGPSSPDGPLHGRLDASAAWDSTAFTLAICAQVVKATTGWTATKNIQLKMDGLKVIVEFNTDDTIQPLIYNSVSPPWPAPPTRANDYSTFQFIATGADKGSGASVYDAAAQIVTADPSSTPGSETQRRIQAADFSQANAGDLKIYVTEILYLSREISAPDKTALLAYWQNLYGT